jgi:uncharacterized repeat protein (TIGR03847 family)
MARIEIDMESVQHITTDAIGKPGSRVFFIQARDAERVVTLLVEKIQVQTLAAGIAQFLDEVATRFPHLEVETDDYQEEAMRIQPPVDPLFRMGEIGLAYEEEHDRVVLLAREILTEGADPNEVGVVRFWCSRSQIATFGKWAVEVVNRGRPICPYCNEPMEPDHLCPKKNGHKH